MAAGGIAMCCAGCASSAHRATTPSQQYGLVFHCLEKHGYVGKNLNHGPYPRILVLLLRHQLKGDFVLVNGLVFRTQQAARRDYLSNERYIATMTKGDKSIGLTPSAVRAIQSRWLSARYYPTKNATACLKQA